MFCNYCGAPNADVASFCNKCGKAVARTPTSAPVQAQPVTAQPIAYVMEMPPAPPSSPAPVVLTSPLRQETYASIGGTLSSTARAEITNGLTVEVRRQIDNKCIPVGIVVWIITMIAVAGWFSIPEFGQTWGMVIGLVMAFMVAGIVTKIMNVVLEDKLVRPIAAVPAARPAVPAQPSTQVPPAPIQNIEPPRAVPVQAAPAPSLPALPHRRSHTLRNVAVVAVLVAAVIVIAIAMAGPSPQTSLEKAGTALINQDALAFDNYVDLQSILSDWTDQAASSWLSSKNSAGDALVANGLVAGFKSLLLPKLTFEK